MVHTIAGIFVGGASKRMGRPKGLLVHAQETLIARWQRVLSTAVDEVVLVGQRPEYSAIELLQLADSPSGIGPLGGLSALLHYGEDSAARESAGQALTVLAVACDMPFVTEEDVLRLSALRTSAPIVAARRAGRWEPFFARYRPQEVLPTLRARLAEQKHSMQGLLNALDVERFAIDGERLDDWDEPADIERRPV